MNTIGAVCPASGEFFAHIWDGVDTKVFQKFLDDFAAAVPKKTSQCQIIALQMPVWQRPKSLNWHHFEPKFLPTYSPDFNPIEQLWQEIKRDHFADFIANDRQHLINHLQLALNSISKPKIQSACATSNLQKKTQ